MARVGAVLAVLLLMLVLVPGHGLADEDEMEMYSIAALEQIEPIASADPGINKVDMRSSGDILLLVGADGYAHIIDAENPGERSEDIALSSGKDEEFNAVSWHPQGQTAFIVGENGMVMRLTMDDLALKTVEGRGALEAEQMMAVEWNRNGDTAYLGGENGSLFRYDAQNAFTRMDKSESPITGLDCHPNPDTRLCVVTSAGDGASVIDSFHEVHPVSNTAGDTWVDVVCPTTTQDVCLLIGSGKRLALLYLDVEEPEKSAINNPEVLSTLEGELTGGSLMGDGSVSLHIAPYSIATYDLDEAMAWAVVVKKDAQEVGSLGSSVMVHAWGSADDSGFILSSNGLLAEMTPIDEVREDDLMSKAIILLVVISIPGVFVGLVFMNSKTLQGWWNRMAAKRRQRKIARLTPVEAED